jgi:uncharacterized protein
MSEQEQVKPVVPPQAGSPNKYRPYLWVFFLAFPFMMNGLKSGDLDGKAPYILPVTAQLNFNGRAIKLEVARTKKALSHGLTYRDTLENDRGMLYKVTSDIYFTGRGMKFPTALVFLRAGKVVDIQQVQPCEDRETKCLEHRTNILNDEVIEVKADITNKLGITVGSTLNITYLPY